MPTPKKADVPRRYHVQLVDGERTLTAAGLALDEGALLLVDGDGETRVIYAPGQWKFAELETQDA